MFPITIALASSPVLLEMVREAVIISFTGSPLAKSSQSVVVVSSVPQTPVDIMTASRTISNNTGLEANAIVMGNIVYQALTLHPDILDRIKYNQLAVQGAIENALSAVLGVDVYVSKASYNSANEGQTFSAAAIIDDDALVCHVNAGAGIMGASAGKTFVWQPGGGAGSIYRDRGTNHADLIQHKEQWDQKAVATDLGYFFSDVV